MCPGPGVWVEWSLDDRMASALVRGDNTVCVRRRRTEKVGAQMPREMVLVNVDLAVAYRYLGSDSWRDG